MTTATVETLTAISHSTRPTHLTEATHHKG